VADLLKILVVMAFLIVLLRRKVNLGAVMTLGAILLAILYLTPPARFLLGVKSAVLTSKSLEMTAALAFTMIMENILRKTGTLKRMVESLSELLPDPRLIMAVMPAVIGMLPSPGGAVFSAPMVMEASSHLSIPADQKAFINYWYRHIWEYVSPLYPGILLVATLTKIPFQQLAMANLPFALSVVGWGAVFGFTGVRRADGKEMSASAGNLKAALTFTLAIAPIVLTLALVVLMKANIVIAMGGVTATLYLIHRYSPVQIVRSLKESISLKALFLIAGIMIFKETLYVTGALDMVSRFFASSGLPILLVISIIPFMAGILTGWTAAYVGITFPILMPLMGGDAPSPGLLAVAFASGFAGVMLSPVHLCLILTREYFNADMAKVYHRLLIPSGLVLASGLIPLIVFP
jgi:integral membrane protein (TIGR00529 family)